MIQFTRNNITEILKSTDEETLVFANHYATIAIRNEFKLDSAVVVAEEAARIAEGDLDLNGYVRANRAGSRFRLSRKLRVAIFTVLATRAKLAA